MKLEIWFEFAITFSYLTVSRVEKLLADAQIELVWRPFLLGSIFRDRGMDTLLFAPGPVKARYKWNDMSGR